MSEENWLRKYIMQFGVEGQPGFSIGMWESSKQDHLRITFDIEKSTASEPNDATIKIYNLSDTSIKILETSGCIVELRAGYKDFMGLILQGSVSSVETTMDKADRVTEITVVDGKKKLQDVYLSISINGAVNTKDLYKRIASEMGSSIVYGNDVTFGIVPNGFTFVGTANSALAKVSTLNGHKWSIQNGVIQVTTPNGTVPSMGYLLSSETGLISIPKRIKLSDSKGKTSKKKKSDGSTSTKVTSKDKEKNGYEVTYFLNPSININDTIEVKSKFAKGYFKVNKIKMSGDTHGGDWKCTAELIQVQGIEVK